MASGERDAAVPMPAQTLPLEVSIYLDLMRFVAALAVFVSHFGLQRLSGGFLWQLGVYGHEAVTVFFVLSGFVIAYTAATRETSSRSYVVSRMARLYSVVVPAVLLTPLLDAIGSTLQPALYTMAWGYAQDLSFWRFFSALTFTNQVWTLNVLQGSNASYWSMGYEVPYYVLFGLATYVPGRWRWPAVLLAAAIYGPSILSALPTWLLGVATWRLSRRQLLSPRGGVMLFAAAALTWALYELVAWKVGRPLLAGNSWFRRRELIQDTIVGLSFAGTLLGLCAAAGPLGRGLLRWQTPIRWLAGATFTLYLLHEPVAQCLLALMPWQPADPRSRLGVFLGTLVVIFMLAAVTERRKDAWRRGITALWDALHAGPPRRL
jgi:peptidoglycan/LPS O-acetylase OafA/YrhL